MPTLPDHLRHPYSVATLQHADYAIRPLRQGFLYVMEKRKRSGQHSLHPPYRIAANGSLSLVDLGQSEPDATDGHTLRDMIRNMAWAFNVHDLEDLAELRLFYSPDPLTEAAQQQLLRRRDRPPAVDVAAFTGLGCPTPRPYVLRHDQLDLVADFAAETDSSLRKLLDNQLFSETSVHSLTAARYMLGPVAGKPEARGIAVVVEDAIGITQQLNAWRNAKTPPERFQVLDLALARSAPAQVGMAMTLSELQVDRQVFEYNQQLPGAFDSVHGFHSRLLRQTATRGYLINAIARHQLEHGVLALVLDDTVGLVQEYNHQRLNWIARRQQWREDPMRVYQLQTSQILQTLRAMQWPWAEQQTPSFEPHSGDGPPVFVDPQVEHQREVERRARDGVARLEERYHEPLRAGFQAEYERQEAEYQRYIDLNTQAYYGCCLQIRSTSHAGRTLPSRHANDRGALSHGPTRRDSQG
ncbi:hypothetical protein PUR31_24160 [Pseudomonas mosselii]|nr:MULTISPECIES: toxin VasX [unclassified Pseudomonas]MCP8636475.1 hypothetical protein [Pseudomonas sp. DVZ6]MDD7787209.1 hypothetical protein [Pseudomonas sp. DVZ24]